MIRNLKVLGLALVAVFAFSAVASSAASAANGRLTSDGPVTLVGTNNAGTVNALTAEFGTEKTEIECPNVLYTGHKYNVTPHELIPSGAETVTLTPHYGVCVAKKGTETFPATVDMNGCDYVLHLLETTATPVDTYGVLATIEGCPTGSHIEITVFAPGNTSHTIPVCHIKIEENAAGYTGLDATDTTNGKIDLTGTATGISASRSGIGCTTASTTTAKLDLNVLGEGKNSKGEATSIGLSHL